MTSDVSWRLARDIDPDAGENGTAAHHEQTVQNEVEWVSLNADKVSRWSDVVSETTNRSSIACHIILLPGADEANEEVATELSVQNLGEEVQVGNKSSLQNNWNVGGVEQLDWEWSLVATDLLAAQSQFNLESLNRKYISVSNS